MRWLLCALLLAAPCEAIAANPFLEVEAFCRSSADATGLWTYYKPDLDGDGRKDLLFPDMEPPSHGPVRQLRVFVWEGAEYRQVGRIPFTYWFTHGEGVFPTVGSHKALGPDRIRLEAYTVVDRRLRRLRSRTVYAGSGDASYGEIPRGTLICNGDAQLIDIVHINMLCGNGISETQWDLARRRAQRGRDLLRLLTHDRRIFEPAYRPVAR